MRYTAVIDGEAGGYGVAFPDLPGCCAMGDTIEDALDHASEALRDWIESMEGVGAAVPQPRPAEALRNDPDVLEALAVGGALASVALVRETGRPVKANLSLDAGVLAAIDAAARKLRITRSGLVELLAKDGLARLT